jgi:serine/threonine protein kinase
MSPEDRHSHDAVTTPVGIKTTCPQCGVALDAFTMTCGACGAVITAGSTDSQRADRVRAKLQDAIGDTFVLGDMLGRGGMGIVFRAREKALDRDVALKVLAFDPVLNPAAYDRFEREAKLAARLDHPNIVPIFAVGQRNGIAFYTMRMVKGGNVEQRVVPGQGFDVRQAITLLRDVASALDYAHANGVVHRDIKPANILMGDSGHAMVADFGIARAFGGDAATTATATGVVGSPAYMSPEQWRGEKVDGKADQYALGILAFELLTGRRPFADAPMQELLRRHLAEAPPDIVTLRNDLTANLGDAIRRAMAKEPEARYPNATSFVDALAADTDGVPAAHVPVRVTVRPSAPLTTAVAPPLRQTPDPRLRRPTRAAPPVPRRTSSGGGWLIAVLLLVLGALGGAIWAAQRQSRNALATVTSPIPAAAASSPDSTAAIQRAQDAENAKLQQEVADARRIALEAEQKMERMLAAQSAASKAKVAPVPELHAHLFVMAQGGKPAVFVDGQKMADTSPAVVEVKPGRHVVTVEGSGTEFQPAEYSIELAATDTTNVTFISRQLAQRQQQRQQRLQQVFPSTLTPEEKQRYYQQLKKRPDDGTSKKRPAR